MKKIIFEWPEDTVLFNNINPHNPIFAKKNGNLCGMVVDEDGKWIVRIGGSSGATGNWESLEDCLRSCIEYGYEFFINARW